MNHSSAQHEIRHYIDGQFLPSESGEIFENFNPATGQIIGRVHAASDTEVGLAVDAARAGLKGEWRRFTPGQRRQALFRIADGISEHAEEFIAAECEDTGKPHSLARFVDIPAAVASFRAFAALSHQEAMEKLRLETADRRGALNYTSREPKGVIAVLCPWNAPLLVLSWKVAPALCWGNTAVVKPSEETPSTASLLAGIMTEAGIPRGVYNVVHGFGSDGAGSILAGHRGIDAITFTGQSATGHAIMGAAAGNLHDVSLELGGKNPAIIFADSDMNKAIPGTMRSVFANCGQVCLGTERVYVEKAVFPEFVQRLKAGAESLRLGDPGKKETTLGPLISHRHRNKVRGYYTTARELGAEIITGGGVPHMAGDLQNGYWIEPTIWSGLAADSPILQEEIFGPCCHVQPFEEEEEVVHLANDTRYGLACAIWTEDAARAERVAGKINAGIVWINHWGMPDLRLPFGGFKASGIGREGGASSREFYTGVKNICVKL